MNAALGRTGVILGLLAALVGVATAVIGIARDRPSTLRRAGTYAYLVLAGALIATIGMERALITHDFSLAYVAQNNSRETPLLYSITGMWSALEGSILLWALILAGYLAAMAYRFRRRAGDKLVGWATLVGLAVAAFFFALMAGPANPFTTLPPPLPADGLGPNPLLQDNPLVAIHPVFLYLGFVGFTIPFAFAVAALVTGRLGEGWLVETRRWTIFAWGFLTIGIVLGAWWSYQVLGWGGFWAWDPVENAALLPWLCATAYLHSVMVQERRGLLRVWNLSLLISAFCLTILATFLTRSGVLESVHSFTQSDIGPEILAFFGVVVAVGVGLIGWRGDRLRSPGTIDAPVSREGAFLVNNLLFAAFAFVVLVGTVFPLFVQALDGQQITIGRPYFDAITVPLGLLLLFFMAVAPALPWRKAAPGVLRARLAIPAWFAAAVVVACVAAGIRGLTPLVAFGLGAFAGASALRQLVMSFLTSRRHGRGAWRALLGRANGGMVVHIGVVIIAVGLAASMSFGQRTELTMNIGQRVRFDGHTLQYLGAASFVSPQRSGVEAAVRVDGGGVFHPAISLFGASTEGVGTPAVDSSVVDDVYLTLASSPTGGKGPVTIDVVIQPLVLWLWVGGGTMAIGAVLAAVPGRRRRREDSELSASGSDRLDAGGAGDADGGGGAGGAEEDEATPAHSPDQAEVFA
jgi:cytochrome c-type biogenesis protein CcmF